MKRLADWWFAPAPAERLAALRILIGSYALVYMIARLPELAGVAGLAHHHFEPTGIVRILDASLAPWLAIALAVATIVLLAAFVAGAWYRVTAPLAALALLWTLSYRSSWGLLFHTENLLLLHLIALACAPAADAWAVGGGKRPAPAAGHGWPIKLLAALTAGTYLLAGIAKLRLGGMGWLDGDLLGNQIAIDNLRKAMVGGGVAPFAAVLLAHPDLLAGFAAATLVIELGAPIALIGGRVGHAWALGAWGFHVGVVLMMYILFPYPLFGFAFLPLVPAERGVRAVIRAAAGIGNRLRR